MSTPDLYKYLKKECPDIETAKHWIYKWMYEWNQTLPWDEKPEYSMRAMSTHISNVLENKSEKGVVTNYRSTKYGIVLFEAACGIL
jgi:hypothetical protein